MYHELNTDTADPVVIVKIDAWNVFNEGGRRTTLDAIAGGATRDYSWGQRKGESFETSSPHLQKLFGYFYAMGTTSLSSTSLYTVGTGILTGTIVCIMFSARQVVHAQVDPLEMCKKMIAFCISVHHIWGRIMGQSLGQHLE